MPTLPWPVDLLPLLNDLALLHQKAIPQYFRCTQQSALSLKASDTMLRVYILKTGSMSVTRSLLFALFACIGATLEQSLSARHQLMI
jgi:hypothetical protein